MLALEKLKRYLLLYDLDEPFQLMDFIDASEKYYTFNNDSERNYKIVELIKYFLENNIFEVGEDYNFEKWDLSLDDTILKIKSMLDSGEDLFYKAFFDLTPKGRQEALNYLDKQFEVQEKVLLACQNNPIDLHRIAEFIQEVFSAKDFEEIEYELLDCVLRLSGWDFIEVIYFVDNKYHVLAYSVYPEQFKDKIKSYINSQEKLETRNQMLCRIAHDGKLVLEEWKKSGGRISDYFDKIIFASDNL